MGKQISTLILAMLLVLTSLVITVSSEQVQTTSLGTTLYVGGAGPGNYTSIQDAIDNASSGDTVFVYSGIYYENVIVNKSIILQGEDKNTTVIDGNGKYDVIHISEEYVIITGFTIINSGYNKTFFNEILTDSDAGVDISSSFTKINNCNISNNKEIGIFINNFGKNTILNNTISINNEVGILIFNSSDNNINKNYIKNHKDAGIELIYSSDNIISENKIFFNLMGNGIFLAYSTNNTIENNNFSNNSNAITLYFESHDNLVAKNMIYSNEDNTAIEICNSNNTIVSENNLINNGDGIRIEGSTNTLVFKNNIDGKNIEYGQGISLALYSYEPPCYNNRIYNNIISNYQIGIIIWSSNNTIEGNTIKNCSDYGIYSDEPCSSLIYHNNFFNNSEHAYDMGIFLYEGINYSNKWNNSSEGNYWDDYDGVDSDNDGIGDTPYIIPNEAGSIFEDNKDFYPLIEPYGSEEPPENAELKVTINQGISIGEFSANVENIGAIDAENVNLSISVEYGILSHEKQNSTVFSVLESGETSGSVIIDELKAIGPITVTTTATADNAETAETTASGWIIGRFIILFS